MWESRRLTTLWASTASYRDSFNFTLEYKRQKGTEMKRKAMVRNEERKVKKEKSCEGNKKSKKYKKVVLMLN
jgi:hypothetical protein